MYVCIFFTKVPFDAKKYFFSYNYNHYKTSILRYWSRETTFSIHYYHMQSLYDRYLLLNSDAICPGNWLMAYVSYRSFRSVNETVLFCIALNMLKSECTYITLRSVHVWLIRPLGNNKCHKTKIFKQNLSRYNFFLWNWRSEVL